MRVCQNSQPVTIEPGDPSSTDVDRLRQLISECFKDVLKVNARDRLSQIKSKDWGGRFVDIESSATIPDKSVVRVLQVHDILLNSIAT